MYIFGYDYNPSFYDIYDYDWSNRDLWRYYEPPPASTDSFGKSLPLGWSTNEKSIAPMGAERTPPWHQASVPQRSYGRGFDHTGTFPLFPWEEKNNIEKLNEDGTPNVVPERINYYNNNVGSAVVIADTHLLFTYHFIINSFSQFPENDATVTRHFMNPSGEMWEVICKSPSQMRRSLTNPRTGNPEDWTDPTDPFLGFTPAEIRDSRYYPSTTDPRRNYDSLILEIDTIKKMERVTDTDDYRYKLGWKVIPLDSGGVTYTKMSDAGIPPITKFSKYRDEEGVTPVPGGQYPLWFLDNQGRCVIAYNSGEETGEGLSGVSSVSSSISAYIARGRNPKVAANTDYVLVYGGDSGTSTWVNTEEHGFVYVTESDGARFVQNIQELTLLLSKIDIPGLVDIEFIDLNDANIKFDWEHPDIDYRSSDTDDETLVPTLTNHSIKVESSFVDDDNEDIDYTLESNEIDVEFNNKNLVKQGSTQNDLTNTITIERQVSYTGVPSPSISPVIAKVTSSDPTPKLYSTYTDDYRSYRYPSANDPILPIKYLMDGVEAEFFRIDGKEILDIIRPNSPSIAIQSPEFDSNGDHYFRMATSNLFDISGELGFFEDKDVGETFNLSVQLTDSSPDAGQDSTVTFDLGPLTKSEPPEGVALEYDPNEIYPGNVVDVTITTTNTPFPDDVSFIEKDDVNTGGCILVEDAPGYGGVPAESAINCSIQSNTQKTLKVKIDDGAIAGQNINLKVYYFWAIEEDPVVSKFPHSWEFGNLVGGGFELLGYLELNAVIIQEPSFTASLIIDPDVDGDGFADTYDDTIKVDLVGREESDIEQYKWTVEFSKFPELD